MKILIEFLKKIPRLVVSIVVLSVWVLIFILLSESRYYSNFMFTNKVDVDGRLMTLENNRRIYFHETGRHRWLNMRQTCAVESAAKNNPQRPVQVFMTSDDITSNTSNTFIISSPWMDVLNSYANVRVIYINESDYFRGTPLEDWYQKGIWRSSPYSTEHLFDYIRMLTAFKGGGHYLDLDFITLKPFNESLLNNFFSLVHAKAGLFANSVFHFDRGQHRLINVIIKRLASSYRPDLWGYNGPHAVTQIVTKFCNFTKKIGPASNQCPDLTILSPKQFFAIHYSKFKTLFENNTNDSYKNKLSSMLQDSFATHVWNKFSKKTPLIIGSNQGYWLFARQHCPITVSRAADFPDTP